MEEKTKLEGIIEYITYQNNDNGYTVCRMQTDDEIITLVGIMPYIIVGDQIEVVGEYKTHPQYGFQFKVDSFDKKLPSTCASIEKYLSSKVIKGIGPLTAKRIVEKFGVDTFEVIEKNPEWLVCIPGMSLKKAKNISADFIKKNVIRDIMNFFNEYLNPSQIVKIYQKWGNSTLDIVHENPYKLSDDFDFVPFETCEHIAKDIEYVNDNLNRIKAGIMYIIKYNQENNGHVYLPESKLIESTMKLLGVQKKQVNESFESLINDEKIVRTCLNEKDVIYEKELFDDERYIVSKLDLLNKYKSNIGDNYFDAIFKEIEKQNEIEYAKNQKEAIKEALENNIFILTGGPGTGKTTITKAMIDIFSLYGMTVELCAPTGRAAKRLEETTKVETKTIHRLLEAQARDDDETIFIKNETNPIDANVIIIDECSMIDLKLMAALLKAVKEETKLIFVGDINQLPPVGVGFVFKDMIKSNRYTTIELNHIFRQAQKSMIIVNAHQINNGEHIDLEPKQGNDFYYVAKFTDEEITKSIVELCVNRIPKKFKLDIFSGLQIISPSKKGSNGTENLNLVLQNVLNPVTPKTIEKKYKNITFRVGDKVMQIKNNYSIPWTSKNEEGMGVYNGDVGIIKDISIRDEEMTVDYDGRVVIYSFEELNELDLAYAMTVHKSQGSEYPIVVIPIFRFSPKLLTRNLLYTAVTRAKKLVVIVGDGNIMNGMIDNNKVVNRFSGLKTLLSTFEE